MPTFPSTPKPFYGSTPTKNFRIQEVKYGDGYTSRVADGLNSEEETWELSWDTLTASEKDTLIAFLDARGGYESFDYTMPTESTSKKWVCKQYSARPKDYGVFSLNATFIRVYDL